MTEQTFVGVKSARGWTVGLLAATAVAACYTGADSTFDGTPGGGSAGTGGVAGGAGAGGGGGSTDCLPAAVQQLLDAQCVSCHGNTLVGGAPFPTRNLADLQAPDPSAPGATVAEGSLARILSDTMPPGGGLSSAQKTAYQQWIAAGAQGVACGGAGGAGGGGGDPYGTPTICTSNSNWSGSNGSRMRPGESCNKCHDFGISGTVYPTAHEPNECNGVSTTMQVVVTDANGNTVLTLNTNSAGNFRSNSAIPAGGHVKVVANGSERAMAATPSSGDCNLCHTEQGTQSAPGRIMAP